jgi:molybdate transport system substrate-binding protein
VSWQAYIKEVMDRTRGRRAHMALHVIGGLAALLLLIVAAAAQPNEPATLTVYAASDLVFALKEVAGLFEKVASAKVALVFGSTGNLAKQIEHGAPADVFFSANEAFVDGLIARGAVIRETRAMYAQGRIVLAVPKGRAMSRDLRGLLDVKVRRIAIANPAHAPYGKAAEEALRAAGVWDGVRTKLVYGENIRHALQFLQTGAVDTAIVALSVAAIPEIDWVVLDASLHAPLNQAAAVVRRSPRPELALGFIQFVNSAQGRTVMKRYGFLLPGEF